MMYLLWGMVWCMVGVLLYLGMTITPTAKMIDLHLFIHVALTIASMVNVIFWYKEMMT